MARIYSLVNQKGGVGKTTTAINLGAYLGQFGLRVLVVDIDPQANATAHLGVDRNTVTIGTYGMLSDGAGGIPQVLHNPRLKISLLPSAPALAGAEIELVSELAREFRLRKSLAPLADRYDYILIDCPPSLGLLTLNGLVAAQSGVLIPVQCEYLALEGLSQLTRTLQRVRAALFPGLKIRGMLPTMFDVRTNLSNDVVAELRRHFPDYVFDTVIPRSVRLAEAPSYGLPISAYAPDSLGGKAYEDLTREVLQGDGVSIPVLQE